MSTVWNYFTKIGKDQAKCNKCNYVHDVNTTELIYHARSKYGIDTDEPLAVDSVIPKKTSIKDYFGTTQKDLIRVQFD